MISSRDRVLSAWGLVALVAVLAAMFLIYIWAPTDAQLGLVQRVFYLHMPWAILTFLAFFVVFVGSVLHLIRSSEKWDWLALSAAELGFLFCSLVLITGSIFAKPAWGTWWTWDPRLTTTLILWFIYVAYLMLRSMVGDRVQAARLAAVVGIAGFVDVPIVFMSIRWWRTIHPVVISGDSIAMDPPMVLTLAVATVAALLLFGYLLTLRYRLESDRAAVARLRMDYEDREEVVSYE